MVPNKIDRANILVEALPHIQAYYGKTIVIKYGGNAMTDEDLQQAVINDIVLLNLIGVKVVVVHGGGPEIDQMLRRVGKEPEFLNGLRQTDAETMDIVQMVLCGKVNKDLVGKFNRAGGRAIGLCGLDGGGLFKATRLKEGDGGNDYGYVGDIRAVDADVIFDTLEKGYIPVVSTVAQGMDGDAAYNINADLAASKLAVAISAEKLMLLTNVCGILEDSDDESTLIPAVSISQVPSLMKKGIIRGGMIPKVECCVMALRNGVRKANIQDGRVKHSILIEILSDEGIGTMFS